MRCPKCGYISFDRQKSCGKCSNDLTAVAEQLKGTVIKAATPFFLGAVLGKQEPAEVEPVSASHEEEETLVLDELEAETPPAGEEELDFAGAPLGEEDLEDQPLPSLGLEDIDVSDLMPLQEEEEEPVLHLGNEHKETILTSVPAKDEEDSPLDIELPGLEPSDEILGADEQESPLGTLEYPAAKPSAEAEEDEIIDLSSLMGFDETPTQPAGQEEDQDIFELTLEDGENSPTPAEEPEKTASAAADIPDLGLTLEKDDQ